MSYNQDGLYQTYWGPRHTAAISDELIVATGVAAGMLGVAWLIAFGPTLHVRWKARKRLRKEAKAEKEKISSADSTSSSPPAHTDDASFLTGLLPHAAFVVAVLVFTVTALGLVSKSWSSGVLRTRVAYAPYSDVQVPAEVGLWIGLTSFNTTLKGLPEYQNLSAEAVEESASVVDGNGASLVSGGHGGWGGDNRINFNEIVYFGTRQGTPGGLSEYNNAVPRQLRQLERRGLPTALSWVIYEFVLDGETQSQQGRQYRRAGYYAHILLWMAIPIWTLTLISLGVGLWGIGGPMILGGTSATSMSMPMPMSMSMQPTMWMMTHEKELKRMGSTNSRSGGSESSSPERRSSRAKVKDTSSPPPLTSNQPRVELSLPDIEKNTPHKPELVKDKITQSNHAPPSIIMPSALLHVSKPIHDAGSSKPKRFSHFSSSSSMSPTTTTSSDSMMNGAAQLRRSFLLQSQLRPSAMLCTLTGLLLLLAPTVYHFLVTSTGPVEILFDGGILTVAYGWSFWLVLCTGIMVAWIGVGTWIWTEWRRGEKWTQVEEMFVVMSESDSEPSTPESPTATAINNNNKEEESGHTEWNAVKFKKQPVSAVHDDMLNVPMSKHPSDGYHMHDAKVPSAGIASITATTHHHSSKLNHHVSQRNIEELAMARKHSGSERKLLTLLTNDAHQRCGQEGLGDELEDMEHKTAANDQACKRGSNKQCKDTQRHHHHHHHHRRRGSSSSEPDKSHPDHPHRHHHHHHHHRRRSSADSSQELEGMAVTSDSASSSSSSSSASSSDSSSSSSSSSSTSPASLSQPHQQPSNNDHPGCSMDRNVSSSTSPGACVEEPNSSSTPGCAPLPPSATPAIIDSSSSSTPIPTAAPTSSSSSPPIVSTTQQPKPQPSMVPSSTSTPTSVPTLPPIRMAAPSHTIASATATEPRGSTTSNTTHSTAPAATTTAPAAAQATSSSSLDKHGRASSLSIIGHFRYLSPASFAVHHATVHGSGHASKGQHDHEQGHPPPHQQNPNSQPGSDTR